MIGLLAIAAPVLAVLSDDSNDDPWDLEEKFLRACAFDNPSIFSVPFVAAVSEMTTDAFLELRSRLIADMVARPTRVERKVLSCTLFEATDFFRSFPSDPRHIVLKIRLPFLIPDGPEAWTERDRMLGPNALNDREELELIWLLLYRAWSSSSRLKLDICTPLGFIVELEVSEPSLLARNTKSVYQFFKIEAYSSRESDDFNKWARSIEARFFDSLSEADKQESNK